MLRPITKMALAIAAVASLAIAAEVEDSLKDVIERTVPLRTHSLSAPYVDSDLQNRWWDFGGDAIINTNKHVRLTQDKPSQKGWLWARMPLSVSNWQIDVDFKVDGKSNNIFGDGFAMWISTDRAKQGPVFGNMDFFNGLGVFFDTYANVKHGYTFPRVTAMLGDGKTAYDHDHDNEAHELAACSENFRRRGEIPTKARLTYIKGSVLQLKLQTKKVDEWKICFQTNVELPEGSYIGFTSATGDVSDNHDIISVSTASVTIRPEHRDKQAALAASSPGRSGKGRNSAKSSGSGGGKSGKGGSWFTFILKIIGVLAFCAFVFAAFRTYNAQKRSRRHW